MTDMKKTVREADKKFREAGRAIDGHDVGDDLGNLGDEITTKVGNAADDVRTGARNLDRAAERHQPR